MYSMVVMSPDLERSVELVAFDIDLAQTRTCHSYCRSRP
jgi:hypothetical protein